MKTITKLALSNNKKNKTRSVLVMVAVFLTMTLLSAIATFGYSTIKYEKLNAEKFYGDYYGMYVGVAEDQIHSMEQRSEFAEVGRAASVGEVENKSRLALSWMGEKALEMTNLKEQLETGVFPEKENEIAGPEEFFEKLGYPEAKQGDKIKLRFRRKNQETYRDADFVVSGITKSPVELENQSYAAYVSEDFYKAVYKNGERAFNAYFKFSEEVQVNAETVEMTAKDLAEECGINPSQTVINTYYTFWALDPGMETILGCVVIALIVCLFSVLVIYNIFQVGIIQKIQEYGKIRALGTTRKQMRKLVFREGMTLALPAIIPGMIAGAGITVAFMHYWLEKSQSVMGREAYTDFSMVSVPLLLLCAAVSLLAVWAALKKPMKLVAKISPVEAIRFQGDGSKRRKGFRKGKRQMSVGTMMTANLAINRKRTVVTILTMGLSCVLFVVISNFTGNISTKYDAKKQVPYGQFQIALDYDLSDTAYPENNLDSILQNNPFDDAFLQALEEIDGVTEVRLQNILYARDAEGNLQSVGVLGKEEFEDEAYQGSLKGTVDYDKAAKEDAFIYGWSYFIEESGYDIGDQIQMELGDKDRTVSMEGEMQGAFGSSNMDWMITEDTYRKLGFTEDNPGMIWVDCKEADCAKVEAEIQNLLEEKEHYELSSYLGALETAESTLGMFEMLAYALLFLVGLIAFMNMANTMIISIITRKRELGVLQALGMTNRQLNGMLRNEGLLFTLGSVMIALAAGMPLGYALFRYGREHGYFGLDVYHVPLAEIMCMILILAVLQMGLSFILSRNVKKESIVERIRYQE